MKKMIIEIIDEIISLTNFKTAVKLQNKYAIRKIIKDKKCSTIWKLSARDGHLTGIQWLHENDIEGCTPGNGFCS